MDAQPFQRTDEWQTQRTGRITSSRVGKILGLSKYGGRDRDTVMREMVRQALGAAPEFTGNTATEYGTAHEADAISAYEDLSGVIVEPSGIVVHHDFDWLAASPDGLVGRDGMIECKCPYRAQYTEPSDEYLAQMQLQLTCAERDWCDFVVWRDGEPLIVKRVFRDYDWLETNLTVLETFITEYHEIVANKELAAPYLADLIRDDAEWRDAADEWRVAKAAADAAKARLDQAAAALTKLAPGGAKGCGITVSRVERAGAIKYAAALKTLAPGADLTPWRGQPTITYRVQEAKA